MSLLPYRKSTLLSAALSASSVLVASAAHAQFFQNNTGLASPSSTITFSETPSTPLAAGNAVTNQFAAYGATFSGLYFNPQEFGLPNTTSPVLGNFSQPGNPPITNPTFSIFFNNALTSAALVLGTNSGTSTFTALNNGVVVFSTATTTGTGDNNYYGFTGITFDQIRITAGGSNTAALIDNVQLGAPAATAVPEPSEYAAAGMFGATLLVGMVKARRKKTAASA